MDKAESYALFQQGLYEWDKWASVLSKERPVDGTESSEWKDWEARATADFQDVTFSKSVDFSSFEFPAKVVFKGVKFKGEALFRNVPFGGSVLFEETNFGGIASFDGSLFGGEVFFKETDFRGAASFHRANFSGDTWFLGSDFKSKAKFSEASFRQDARFDSVDFNQSALFDRAAFQQKARFLETKFEAESLFPNTSFDGPTSFVSAAFKGNTSFSSSRFYDQVDFSLSIFKNRATFDKICCKSDVDFSGIQSEALFRVAGARFLRVPNFDQASFSEPPPLHSIQIEQNHSWILPQFIRIVWKGEQGQEARWRTLKRLALQAHDYIREQEFHANEIRMRRGTTDQFWKVSYLFGILYEFFSNFGQSIARPLWWWAFGVILSAIGYSHLYYYHATGKFWPVRWFETPIEIWTAAFGLALHRGFPAVSGLGNRLPDYHSVLYNVGSRCGQASVSPSLEAVLGQIQILFSTAMIFLFLLALRNRFRMK